MTQFLDSVARDMLRRIPLDEMPRTMVILPNRRAGLFLSEHLASHHDGPMLAPSYMSLQDLAGRLSGLRPADPIVLSCLCHEVYRSVLEEKGLRAEPIDDFLPWAEMMISDFSEVDHYGVDAARLFTNLREMRDLDSLDFLTQEQVDEIRTFFGGFRKEQLTELKKKFLLTWEHLGEIYERLHQVLLDRGLAYGGMMIRQALEKGDLTRLDCLHAVFAGHGALTGAERRLLERIRQHVDCLFYWDLDPRYLKDGHEAGYFIRKNIALLGSALREEEEAPLPEITVISTPGDLVQGRLVAGWFHGLCGNDPQERGYAVILPDEGQLLTVLHSLPKELHSINVTMGYPVSLTMPCALIQSLLDLQERGFLDGGQAVRLESLITLSSHPLIRDYLTSEETDWIRKAKDLRQEAVRLDDMPMEGFILRNALHMASDSRQLLVILTELLDGLTVRLKEAVNAHPSAQSDLCLEAIWRCHMVMDRLLRLQENGFLNVLADTMRRLLRRLLTSLSIPFHGEAAQGLQVMGVLESRALDFKHLMILSMNENFMPRGAQSQSSFIPYSLRAAYGLPSLREHSALYAYTFYRLLRCCEDITLVYNAAQTGVSGSEMSRFILQLLSEDTQGKIRKRHLELPLEAECPDGLLIPKTPEMQKVLLDHYTGPFRSDKDPFLSPSALNCYMNCKLQFYFRYVLRLLRPQDEALSLDAATIGTIFHKAAENLYLFLTQAGPAVLASDLEKVDRRLLEKMVDSALETEFLGRKPDGQMSLGGGTLLLRRVLVRQLEAIVKMDLRSTSLRINDLEANVRDVLEISSGGTRLSVRVGGVIDREDTKDGIRRILDYKTGGKDEKLKTVQDLFRRSKDRPYRDFQVFFYALMRRRSGYGGAIRPAVLYLRNVSDPNYSPGVIMDGKPVEDAVPYLEEFSDRLTALLEEMFSPDDVYAAPQASEDADRSHCAYCDYAGICALREAGRPQGPSELETE